MSETSNSTNINSIEEFRACYEQELKEILEELNKNGVTNIEGVKEVIKLFFDEYYQYLSVQALSSREAIEEIQRSYYNFKEKKYFLECFKDVIPEEFYSKLEENDGLMMGKKSLTFSSENDIKLESTCREYKIEHLKKTFDLEKICWKIGYKFTGLFEGSIIYNGNLKRLEELLDRREKVLEEVKKNKKQMEEIPARTITDFDAFSLKNISYAMPSDLFEGFNSYLFKIVCECLYLDTHYMFLSSSNKYNTELLEDAKLRERHMIGKIIKITEEDLKSYLTSQITLGSFWKENIIEQFLNKFSSILYLNKLDFWFAIENYAFYDIERLYNNVNRKRGIRILPKSRESRRNSIFWDIVDSMKRLNTINEDRAFLSCCQVYDKEIDLKYKRVVAGIEELSNSKLTEANVNNLKNEFLNFIDSIKQCRIELAMEIFGLTEEKVKQMSSEELKQKYQKLKEDNYEHAKNALERLKTNKKESMRESLPNFIKENIKELEQTKSTIEKLEQELVAIDQEIRNLAEESVQDSIQDKKPLPVRLGNDNSELHLYIVYKLIKKYINLLAPKILENSEEREKSLLENYKNLDFITPYGLQEPDMPVIGPSVTRILSGKK